MREIHLTQFARARVWREPAFHLSWMPDGALRGEAGGRRGTAGAFIALEALVPRGAKSDYGYLALRYRPDEVTRVRVEVPYAQSSDARWADSMAHDVDDVRVGLTREYSGAVLDGLLSAANALREGSIVIPQAAHGLVGSSPDFFRRLARCAVERLLWEEEGAEASVAEHLRRSLVESCD